MNTSQSIGVTLSSEMAEESEKVRKAEKRAPTGLVQEALRNYLFFLREFPEIQPSPIELKVVRRGRQAFARGQYVHLDELVQDVDNEARRKKSPSRAKESEPRP